MPYDKDFTDKVGDHLETLQAADGDDGGKKPKFTELSKDEDSKFQEWRKQLPKNLQNDSDYDLQGLYKENPNAKPSSNLHFTDKYKKPNHITFSDESIYNNQGGKGGHWGKEGGHEFFKATDQNIKNAGGIQKLQEYFKNKEPNIKLILPEKPIPRPAPDNQESVQKYRNELHKKYGEALKDREDIPEYLSQTYEQETTPVKDIIAKSAPKSGLRPELLYASSMEEGMRGLFPTAKNKGQIDHSGHNHYPISGFVSFGLDTFSDRYPELKKKGYLPSDFNKNFEKSIETRQEKTKEGKLVNEKVNSANFKDLSSAVQAKAAMVKLSQDEIQKFAEQKKISLSEKAKEFFTLVNYNAGSGNAQKMLEEYSKKGYLDEDKFLDKQPSQYWTGPYQNVIKRVKAANVLKSEGYF